MKAILARLGDEIAALRQDRPFERNLIASVVDYYGSYQFRCHHRNEQIVFRRLRRRHSEVAAALCDLMDEHADLAQAVRQLSQCLDQAFYSPEGGRERLCRAVEDFATLEHAHMGAEEARFFPAALEHLTSQDWEEMDFAVFGGTDPEFSDLERRRLHTLRAAILEGERAAV